MHILLAALVALATPPPNPPPAIVTLTQTVLDAANADDASKFAGLFTSDGVVVDEDTPFVWTGADAGVKWWHSVQRSLATRKVTLHASGAAFTEFRIDGNAAYAIQPLTIAASAGSKTHVEHGMETYTFRNVNGAWKISSATWTTTP